MGPFRQRFTLATLATLVVGLVSPLVGTAAAQTAIGGSRTLPTVESLPFWLDPEATTPGSRLEAVAAVAPDDVWAVGASYDGQQVTPLLQHYDGNAWITVPGPAVQGDLTALSAVASDDVWAVGYRRPYGREGALIMHWDGTSWTLADVPPFRGVFLTGVAALPNGRAVAVGDRTIEGFIIRGTATIRIDGDGATRQNNVNPAGYWKVIDGIAMSSPVGGWRVGELLPKHGYRSPASAEHWNGRRWVSVPPVQAESRTVLSAVAIVHPGDVWAVGSQAAKVSDNGYKLVEHWADGRWEVIPTPNLHAHASFLSAVAATSDDDVWVVGQAEHTGHWQTLTMHWDGQSWQPYRTPDRGVTPGLSGVTAGRDATWAVGSDREGPGAPYRDFWNGHAWVAR